MNAGDVVGLAADLAFDTDLLCQPIRRYAQEDVQKLGLIADLLVSPSHFVARQADGLIWSLRRVLGFVIA